jgi:NADPH-dependent 2,4-dienoyl-CoA reductase/sulfur reductase-like enzyme
MKRQERPVVIGGEPLAFPGVIGSFCFKVFGLEVASTGLTEEEARKEGLEAKSATVEVYANPAEYPGSKKITLRLVADGPSGRVLGAQAAKTPSVNEIPTKVRQLFFRLQNANRPVVLYGADLLPQAMRAMEIAETWYL